MKRAKASGMASARRSRFTSKPPRTARSGGSTAFAASIVRREAARYVASFKG